MSENELNLLVSYYINIDNSSKENALWKALRIINEVKPSKIALKHSFNLSSIYNIEKGTNASAIKWTSFKQNMLKIYHISKEEYLQIYDFLSPKKEITEKEIKCVSRFLKINSFSCLAYYLRSKSNRTQQELATELKITRQYYQMMESGKRIWSSNHIFHVCKLLGIDFFKSSIVSESLLKLNTKPFKA